jgi:hypothetical protein
MHPQGRFRDADFQLIEVARQVVFPLADEPVAPSLAEIKCRLPHISIADYNEANSETRTGT